MSDHSANTFRVSLFSCVQRYHLSSPFLASHIPPEPQFISMSQFLGAQNNHGACQPVHSGAPNSLLFDGPGLRGRFQKPWHHGHIVPWVQFSGDSLCTFSPPPPPAVLPWFTVFISRRHRGAMPERDAIRCPPTPHKHTQHNAVQSGHMSCTRLARLLMMPPRNVHNPKSGFEPKYLAVGATKLLPVRLRSAPHTPHLARWSGTSRCWDTRALPQTGSKVLIGS